MVEPVASNANNDLGARSTALPTLRLADANFPLYLLKLALGALTLLALCAAAIFLIVAVTHLSHGETDLGTLILSFLALVAVGLTGSLFYRVLRIGTTRQGPPKARFLNLCAMLLALASFGLIVLALVVSRTDETIGWLLGAIAIASGYVAFRLNEYVKRLSSLPPLKLPRDFRGPFKVYRSKDWFLRSSVGVVFFGAIAYWAYLDKPDLALLSALIGVALLVVLISEVRKMDAPVLSIDARGISTETYLLIPWAEIDRVFISARRIRYQKHHFLVMLVDKPENYTSRENFLKRWSRRLQMPISRDSLEVPLDLVQYEPEDIEGVIKHFRRAYAESVGVELETGDLSFDRRRSQISKLFKETLQKDIPESKAAFKKMMQLERENDQELRHEFERLRKSRWWLYVTSALALVFIAIYLWQQVFR